MVSQPPFFRGELLVSGSVAIWVFLKIVVPQNGWFIINYKGQPALKIDDLGVFPLILG